MTQSRRRSDFSLSFSFSEWKTTTAFCERTLEEWKEPFVLILLLMTAAPPQTPPSFDGPRGAEPSLRGTPVVGVSNAAGSSANAANFHANAASSYQEVERYLHLG